MIDSDKLVTNITLDVGLNSKSTFNTALKKMVDIAHQLIELITWK